jgi:redox-sensing transcriptional repressor
MQRGNKRTSSYELGRLLGFTSSQVRQDFSCFGEFGQQGYGYRISTLRDQLSSVLGMERGYKAILLGCGNIGRALLCNFEFNNYGFNLMCGFDINPDIIGTSLNGVEIKPMEELEVYLAENHVNLAVLCVPKWDALSVTGILERNGIDAIWNFTNVDIVEPDSQVIVENLHFSDSLLSLSYYLKERIDAEETRKFSLERTENFSSDPPRLSLSLLTDLSEAN